MTEARTSVTVNQRHNVSSRNTPQPPWQHAALQAVYRHPC